MSPPCVLVVEEMPRIAEMIAGALTGAGYGVLLAPDAARAREALEAPAAAAPMSALLCHLHAPPEGGAPDLVRSVRQRERQLQREGGDADADAPRLPLLVVMTSGLPCEWEGAQRVKARVPEADAWLVRPFNPSQIPEMIANLRPDLGAAAAAAAAARREEWNGRRGRRCCAGCSPHSCAGEQPPLLQVPDPGVSEMVR